MEVRPVDSRMFISREQSWFTAMERLFSSPGLYRRKKAAGRDISRMIMEAWTPTEVLMSIRLIRRVFVAENSWEETATQATQIASDSRTSVWPEARTGPVSSRMIRGISMPARVTARAAAAIRRKSLRVTERFIYSSRSEIPSFF